MNEDDARHLLLVRAVEQEDSAATLLTEEDRRQADAFARVAISGGGRDAEGSYLARRSEFAARRLETRHPVIENTLRRSRWPGWIGIVVPVSAFVLGVVANEIGNARRLDLLALPLLGTIAWNIAVYLWLGLHFLLRRHRGARPHGVARAMLGLTRLGQQGFDRSNPVARGLHRFVADWSRASAPLAAARGARTLHVSAAVFALGLIAGIYLRALAIEYRAGWESTFLGPAAVHALLAALLGPASAITGVPIPDTAGIAALRWTGPDSGGANAGPWIHLFTATTFALIVVPRLALAIWSALRAAQLSRRFPVPGREDFYVRRLLRAARGGEGSVRVTAYAYVPDAEVRRRLESLLGHVFGDAMQVRFDDPVDYGGEDAWLAAATLRPDDDQHVVLFSLSATPEEENHGAFVTALAARLKSEGHGTALAAIVDESAFRRHFAGQSGTDERIAARRKAWHAALSRAGIAPLAIDLGQAGTNDVQRIEAALVTGAALEAGT